MMTACSEQNISVDQQVEDIFSKMTQEEKIAQLHGMYLEKLFDENGKLDTAKCREMIPNGVGHFSQFAMNTQNSPDELRDKVAQMQEWLINNTPSGIPALFHEEVLSGVNTREATIYPQQIGLACSFNPELAEKKTYETASLLHKMGGYMALSPMVDVCRNPPFNRMEESYGEDGYLSAAMGVAFVKGLQHDNLKEGVAACTKHFLGYGGGGDTDRKQMMEDILLPHEAIIQTVGSHVLMPGYHAIDGTKCVANKEVLTDILRDYLKFDGIVVSDYGAIEQVNDSLDDVHRAALALNAGNDVDFPEGKSYKHLPEALAQGLVTQEAIDRAVKRVLKLKAQLGLFDKDRKLYAEGHIEADTKEERETAYTLATQSVVLLKNNPLPTSPKGGEGILPLTPEKLASLNGIQGGASIFLTGPNANSMWAMCGDYSYPCMRYFWKKSIEDGQHPHVVTLKEGIENIIGSLSPEGENRRSATVRESQLAGVRGSYSRGCNWTEEVETVVESSGDPRVAYLVDIQNRMVDSGEKADWDEAIRMAAQNDVIIAAVGENVILCGENRDRKHLRLPGRQEEFVKALIATDKPVVLVVFGGRPQIIKDVADKCAAVIQAWYPGEEGGNALADILFGKVSPSGRLSVSYPNQPINENVCYNYSTENDPRIEWPFGYGLSYTTFEYSNLQVDKAVATDAEAVNVSFEVKNTGKMASDDVPQLYISSVNSKTRQYRPIQLEGFKRITLKPGETKKVTLALAPSQFGYFANNEWNIAPGRFIVKIGASSRDIRLSQEVELTGKDVTMPLRKQYFAK